MGSHNVELGRDGEAAAAAFYQNNGYEIVERNWRCSHGEVDLILAMKLTTVFVEVKTRSSDRYGSPAEAVGVKKQQRLRRVASVYLRTCSPAGPRSIRFDVASVLIGARGMKVEVIEAAF